MKKKYPAMAKYETKKKSIIRKLVLAMIENEITIKFTNEEEILIRKWMEEWILDNSNKKE